MAASRVCVDCAGQTQAVIGCDNLFEVILTRPALSAPTGSIKIKGTSYALEFLGQAPIEITSLKPGRRALVLRDAPTRPLAGRQGAASVVTDSFEWPCQIQSYSVSGGITTATLADALQQELPAGTTAQLVFRYWAAVLPRQTAPVKGCKIDVVYSPVSRVGEPETTITFDAAYVRQLFETGFTAQHLREFLGSPSSPTADAGLEPAVAAGLNDLVRHLRVELAERGLTEADIPAASALFDAHRLYAAAAVYAVTNRDLHDSLRSEARYAADDALRHLWIDLDPDGNQGAHDTLNITGLRSKDFSYRLPPKPPRIPWLPGRWR